MGTWYFLTVHQMPVQSNANCSMKSADQQLTEITAGTQVGDECVYTVHTVIQWPRK